MLLRRRCVPVNAFVNKEGMRLCEALVKHISNHSAMQVSE